MKVFEFITLAGAYLCALGYIRSGLVCFVIGGIPGIVRRDWFTILFMGSSLIGLTKGF
jgi:hypothetical protein